MRKYTIEDAKRLITDFCEEEYGTDEYVELVKHKEDTICC